MADTIKIVCANCGREVDTPRCDTDPPNAVRLEGVWCPDCDNGGFDMPDFFDADGNWLEPTAGFISDRMSKYSLINKEPKP
tara:strand:- start:40052 stop:40294 length:243 start_codon:yes stop_codon:yes gene_type:complete